MADYRAIEAVSASIVRLLQTSYERADFDDIGADFAVFTTEDFDSPLNNGISLFLYRVVINGSHRIPNGRRLPNGDQFQTRLPVDLHYLMVIWAGDASMQHRLAGWLLRTMEDTPILPVGLVDTVMPGVFQPDEAVEILLDKITTEDLMRIWDALQNTDYQLSIPYIVRNVRIESRHLIPTGEPVQQRSFDMGRLDIEE